MTLTQKPTEGYGLVLSICPSTFCPTPGLAGPSPHGQGQVPPPDTEGQMPLPPPNG